MVSRDEKCADFWNESIHTPCFDLVSLTLVPTGAAILLMQRSTYIGSACVESGHRSVSMYEMRWTVYNERLVIKIN